MDKFAKTTAFVVVLAIGLILLSVSVYIGLGWIVGSVVCYFRN